MRTSALILALVLLLNLAIPCIAQPGEAFIDEGIKTLDKGLNTYGDKAIYFGICAVWTVLCELLEVEKQRLIEDRAIRNNTKSLVNNQNGYGHGKGE